MSDLWEEYNKEGYERETITTDQGFICYKPNKDGSMYIHILYIKPEFRKKGAGKELEMMAVNKHGATSVWCYVNLESKDPETSLVAIIKAGYKIYDSDSSRVLLSKKV